MSSSKRKTSEEYISEIRELKQKLSEKGKDLKKQSNNSRRLEEGIVHLTASDTQLQHLFNQFDEGFALCELIFDKQGNPCDYRFLKMNSAFERHTGMNMTLVHGKTVREIFPDIEQFWIDKYGSVVLNKKAIHFTDYNHNTKKHYRVDAYYPSKNYFIILFNDITEKLKAKERMKAFEKKYSQLYNSMDEMFQMIELIYDTNDKAIDYTFLQVNPAFEKLVNKKAKDLIGKRAKKVFGIVEDYWISTYEKVDKTGENKYYTNYGKELDKYYKINAWKVDDKKIAIVFTDITEKRKADIALKTEKEAMELTEQIARLGGWSYNVKTKTPYLSKGIFDIYELSTPRLLSLEEGLKFYAIEDRPKIEKAFQECLEKGKPYDLELGFVTEKGNKRWIRAMGKADMVDGEVVRLNGILQDISKLKKVEDELKASDERYDLAMHATRDGLYDWNLLTNEIYYSPGWKRMLGYEDKELPNDFSIWEKLIRPEDVKSSWKMQQELISKQRSRFEMEFKMQHKEGHWVDILSRAEAVFDKNGKAIRIVGTHVDISVRKRYEEEIRATKENLKNTFDISPSIIGKANIETGYFTETNKAITRILGHTTEEFMSRKFIEFIHPDDQQRTMDEISQQMKGSITISFENRYLCKDGSYKWIAWNSTEVDKNGIITIIGSDINAQKQAEAHIHKLSTAVQQSPSMIVITDSNGIVEYVNPKFTEVSGYSISESIGRESNILKSGKQDASFYKKLWKTLEAGKVWRGQFHNKKKNGELFWEAASIAAIINESGIRTNFVKIGEDITLQKDIESELIIALEKAQQSDQLKSAFLANMSHEIRTPMNGILGFINLLAETDLNKAQIVKYTGIINKSGDRLLTTINNIFDISKIEAGEIDVSIRETYLNSLMDELHTFFVIEAKQKGLSFFCKPSLPTEKAKVFTDSQKLHAILTNLISNAIKCTNKGHIIFGYYLKEKFIEFYVEDTGIGVPKNRMRAIFNRFEQADMGNSRVLEGSGLGLAISKAYVEMLGGEISLISEEGKGSVFTFTIPYIETIKDRNEPDSKTVENVTANAGKFNLLIVEDDEISAELLKLTLKGMFKKIIFVDKGKDAVEMCRNMPDLDLVLMDIKMPGMNGYDATREIRRFNKDLVIIAQTAHAMLGDKEKAIQAGCNDYITKPIDKGLLIEMIDKLLK